MELTEEYSIIRCARCDAPFALPSEVQRKYRRSHETFYCPYRKCNNYYPQKSDVEKAKDQAEQEKRRAEAAIGKANRMEAEMMRTSSRLVKLRERIKNGVCPCCNRSFENLQRHMKSQHPEFGTGGMLRHLRSGLEMTQSELAEILDLSTDYISRFERDKHLPEYARQTIQRWMDGSEQPV